MKTEMLVPITEVLGVPGWLTGEAKEAWCRDNKVTIYEDWNGRECVDVPTAFRIKAQYDKQLAKARQEQAEQIQFEERVREAQRAREEMLGRAFVRESSPGVNPHTGYLTHDPSQALPRARAWVLEQERDLPKPIRDRLYWPALTPMIFDR